MKAIKTIPIEPMFVDFIPGHLEENKIYISWVDEISVHSCLCGCGGLVTLSLNRNNGSELTKNNMDQITIIPSISNYHFECNSHYIIMNNEAKFI